MSSLVLDKIISNGYLMIIDAPKKNEVQQTQLPIKNSVHEESAVPCLPPFTEDLSHNTSVPDYPLSLHLLHYYRCSVTKPPSYNVFVHILRHNITLNITLKNPQ